jgi:type II secretory pathway pseudopilin PulG
MITDQNDEVQWDDTSEELDILNNDNTKYSDDLPIENNETHDDTMVDDVGDTIAIEEITNNNKSASKSMT